MLRIILTALRSRRTTEPVEELLGPAAAATRGRPTLDPNRCDGDSACEAACPTTAISLSPLQPNGQRAFTLDYGACVFCGRCAEACAPGALTMTADYALATQRREDMILRVLVQAPQERKEG